MNNSEVNKGRRLLGIDIGEAQEINLSRLLAETARLLPGLCSGLWHVLSTQNLRASSASGDIKPTEERDYNALSLKEWENVDTLGTGYTMLDP